MSHQQVMCNTVRQRIDYLLPPQLKGARTIDEVECLTLVQMDVACKSYCQFGYPLIRNGKRTGRTGSKLPFLSEPIALDGCIDFAAMEFATPPLKLVDLSIIANIERVHADVFARKCTPYLNDVVSPDTLPSPNNYDLARFVLLNSHGIAHVECQLLTLVYVPAPLYRAKAQLDVLTFLFWRYPNAKTMRALRCQRNLKTLASLMTLGGYDFTSEDPDNYLEQFKRSIRSFVVTWLKGHASELQVEERWFHDYLPDPRGFSWGCNLLAPLPQSRGP